MGRKPAPIGKRCVAASGYAYVNEPGHVRGVRGWPKEHIVVAERALGRRLPPGALVHHINGVKDDNRPQNLVICQSQSYHALIHQRQRAYDATGNANLKYCHYCGKYDDPANMAAHKRKKKPNPEYTHRECASANAMKYYTPRGAA